MITSMRLDKTRFTYQTYSQASEHQEEYKNLTSEQKSANFFYLMQVAFGFVGKPWPKMDKTHFEVRKR